MTAIRRPGGVFIAPQGGHLLDPGAIRVHQVDLKPSAPTIGDKGNLFTPWRPLGGGIIVSLKCHPLEIRSLDIDHIDLGRAATIRGKGNLPTVGRKGGGD